jgi:hypothetical protein
MSADFVEIGSSDQAYDMAQALASVEGWSRREIRIESFGVRLLATDIALATYCAGGSLRSSIWVRGEGGWQVIFHQGTPSPSREKTSQSR